MTLSAEQKTAVAQWVAAGDSLAVVQRKLTEQFKLSLTYMDVRFLVDDLGLELKSAPAAKPAPAGDFGAKKMPTEPEPRKGLLGKLKDAVGGKREEPVADEPIEDDDAAVSEPALDATLPAAGGVKVEVDRICRPGTVVSGAVTFSDGVSGKWAMDQMGRLMLDAGKGYKPSPADIQSFQAELGAQLQRMGY